MYTLVKTISPKISFAFCISVYYIVKIINSHRSKVCCAPTAVLCVCVYLQITLRCDICGNGIIRGHSNYSRCALCWKVLWLGYSGRRGRRTFKPTPHQLTPCSWLLCKLRRRSHTFVHKAADNTRTRGAQDKQTHTHALLAVGGLATLVGCMEGGFFHPSPAIIIQVLWKEFLCIHGFPGKQFVVHVIRKVGCLTLWNFLVGTSCYPGGKQGKVFEKRIKEKPTIKIGLAEISIFERTSDYAVQICCLN